MEFIDRQSDQIHELMGQIPSYFVRWGTSITALMLVIIFFLFLYIKIPNKNQKEGMLHVSPAKEGALLSVDILLLEGEMIGVVEGKEAMIEVNDLNGEVHKFRGRVVEIGDAFDASTRKVKVSLQAISKENLRLLSGMTAHISINMPEKTFLKLW